MVGLRAWSVAQLLGELLSRGVRRCGLRAGHDVLDSQHDSAVSDTPYRWVRAEVSLFDVFRRMDSTMAHVPSRVAYPVVLRAILQEAGIEFEDGWSRLSTPTLEDLQRTMKPPHRVWWDFPSIGHVLIVEQGQQ